MLNKLYEVVVGILMVGLIIFGATSLITILVSMGPIGILIGIGIGYAALKGVAGKERTT